MGAWLLGFGIAGQASAQNFGGWEQPPGGWDYLYEANDGEEVDGEFDPVFGGLSLDGTWTHNNGSDAWDGSGPGDATRPDGVTPHAPGGAGIDIITGAGEGGGDAEVLSVVDVGDPRTAGFADPSNRKLWFCHDVAQDAVDGSLSLRNGLTILVRSRGYPDIDPEAPGWQLPDGGVDNDAGQGVAPGYTLRDGGKGGHGFYDAGLDRNLSLTPYGTSTYQFPPLVAEGVTPPSLLDVGDNTIFHALWITVSDEDANDRFDVTVYVNGATSPSAVFDEIQLGDDTDCDGISHLHFGFHSTPQIGGLQIDYFGYKVGFFEPTSPCPGGLAAAFDEATGNVVLSWSPVASVDSYTVRRGGVPIAEGLAASTTGYTDTTPTRPSAEYQLVPIVGGAPKPGCTPQSVSTGTVVCPALSCAPDAAAGQVTLDWTAPKFFSPASYRVLRNGSEVGTAPGAATQFIDTAPPGEHTYELEVVGGPAGACAVNAFCEARLFSRGAIDVSGDGWDRVVTGGVASIVTTTDGVQGLYFPAVAKGPGDTASFAASVAALGAGETPDGRYRVEIRARYDNAVRITNRSLSPPSFVHFELSRTGISTATDENGATENVEQVPAPQDDPTLDSASSTVVNTDAVGIELTNGLNLIEVSGVDGAGVPHADNVQLFAVRIGPFAPGLQASLADYPCPAGLGCARDGVTGAITLTWTAAGPHAYEVERDGALIATIPMGATTSHTDPDPGPGFFTYTLRPTDAPLCPEISCQAGGGVPDPEGFIREWLIFGPLDWGCVAACDAPGEAAIRADYLAGTSGGDPVDQETIEPVAGTEIALGPQATVRATARPELNPGRPGTGTWFAYQSSQALIDYNLVFGGDPGNNYMTYAATYVENTSGADLVADLGVTSDDAVQVFLNDLEIHINNVARGVDFPGTGAFDVVPGITIPAGKNRILVKVFEGGGDNGFALRFENLGQPVTADLLVSLAPGGGEVLLRRGDADGNGTVNITDPIFVLNGLFTGGPPTTCPDAADGDDSGGLNITDPIRVLNFLFTGGPAPPLPGTRDCGPDPTEDALPACVYSC